MEKEILLNKEEFTSWEVAEITDFHRQTITKYCKKWVIKAYRRWTRNYIVTKKDLNDFLSSIWREHISHKKELK